MAEKNYDSTSASKKDQPQLIQAPAISLPKGGGAIHGMGEKFGANPVTGTASMSIPIATSPGRAGFGPQLSVSYDSGAGNGPFGFGWSISLPSITRKTDKGLPQYCDADETDIFVLSGVEDLVPEFEKGAGGDWVVKDDKYVIHEKPRTVNGVTYNVRRFRPRIEGLFARIERWSNITNPGDVHWRSLTKDNVLTLYGSDANSRIVDPEDSSRIFSWLICETRDDKGNAVVYRYKAEDGLGVNPAHTNERNRGSSNDARRTANRYLKHIFYGNQTSLLDKTGQRSPFLTKAQIDGKWMFEVVFDYGEHDRDVPRPKDTGVWAYRSDPFSSYRSGFEVRTTRLCQRVLMFHHFIGEEDVGKDCLVRSTDFIYSTEKIPADAHAPVYAFLQAVSQSGYKRNNGGYLKRSLPPVEFEYTEPSVQDAVHDIDAESLENLPIGVDGATYRWIDLHGEGIPGILSEQANAWFYKRNLSPIGKQSVELAPVERVAAKPNLAIAGGAQFMDLASDGQTDLVVMDGPMPGLYEHDEAEDWQSFHPFTSRLNRDMGDPNLKLVDLDGDGHADVLITEDNVYVWHRSLAEVGFGPAQRVVQALDEEKGPRLVFADGTQSIYLADMSGDGLTDLVRIRNCEVCYWPNLGYCRFGEKVSMDQAPHFDNPEQFDQKRIRLADIDGSGTTDIIYLHRDGVRLYFNHSGNGWSTQQALRVVPRVDDIVSIAPTDLFGNGTACLVWSSPLTGDSRCQMRYVDLMGGQKPHLLVKIVNNLGVETHVQYASSIKFYLQDKRNGKPWITKLPFPVHCVENVTVTDKWRKTRFTTTYSYHHGYYDGIEREFRGFGRVEQIDVEDYGTFVAGNAASPYITDDKTLYQPPVKTVTWYHTGVFFDRQRILSHLEHEYFPHWLEDQHPGLKIAFQENPLPPPDLEAESLTAEEWREALRACKGMMLRQEVIELDIDALERSKQPEDREQLPVKLFSTTYHNCHIRRLQPKDGNRHAVFLAAESEAITYHYELDIRKDQLLTLNPDPRIVHTLNLQFDEYAKILQSVAVVYPRLGKFEDDISLANGLTDALSLIHEVQKETHIAYSETRYTEDFGTRPADTSAALDNYRLRLPCEVLAYELSGIKPQSGLHFTLDELRAFRLSLAHQKSGAPVPDIPYHQIPNRTTPEKRLIEHARTLFFSENLAGPLPFGEHGRLGLTYENYKLALTETLLDAVFKDTAGNNKLDQAVDGVITARAKINDPDVSGYLSGTRLTQHFAPIPAIELKGQYWIRSGIAGFTKDATQHFYLPEQYTDPFGNVTTLQYDGKYDLFLKFSIDARDNKTEVENFDFRVLAPRVLKDMNDNLSEVYFDLLGLPVALAMKGKGNDGDNLTGFTDTLANPTLGDLAKFFNQTDLDDVKTRAWLGNATARHLYYFGEIKEKLADGTLAVRWGRHSACACGIVRERHVAQLTAAEQSPLQTSFEYSDGLGSVLVKKVQAEPEKPGQPMRWIANGKTILNNKGKPVKQYEPYFSSSGHKFEEPKEEGVTRVIYYDAAGRVMRTEIPDGSYSRVEFSPWHVRAFDRNDTVKESDNAWFGSRTAASAIAEEKRAAQLAAEHANTPILTILDSLGREVISVAHNRVKNTAGTLNDEKYLTFTQLDSEGKPLWIQDARKNLVMQYIAPPMPTNQAANPSKGFTPCYDIAGNLLFQHSMDSGDRWMLNDAAGKPMLAWDFNERPDKTGMMFPENRLFFTRYDALHRPLTQWLTINGGPPKMVERFEYIDSKDNIADAPKRNLQGQLHKHFDSSGLKQIERLDFKGNSLELRRQLAQAFDAPVIDWQTGSPTAVLETETFAQLTEYDALNRMKRLYNWHRAAPGSRVAVYEPQYGERGLLVSETIILRAIKTAADYTKGTQTQETIVIRGISYDAKGQKERIEYGNDTTTRYSYDPENFRLRQLRTVRAGYDKPLPRSPSGLKDDKVLQNLYYTYDPIGNITEIRDDAYIPVFFQNQKVEAVSQYTYDALYRLTHASGRESGAAVGPPQQLVNAPTRISFPVTALGALRNYAQDYSYDAVGNISKVKHEAGPAGSWTRAYSYAADSNRLLSTTQGDAVKDTTNYRYDPHGNMLNVANVAPARFIAWDHRDMIHFLDLQGGGFAYYNYDVGKQRTRKRLKRAPGTIEERIDLGGLEIYRRFIGGLLVEEIESIHVFEDQQRVLLIDDVLQTDNTRLSVGPLYRYQYGNHLGSAVLELDDQSQVISYEEYHPYGTTAYEATRNQTEKSKRYRYTGKERDEETGFSYYGARYYATWLGRWVGCDPAGLKDGINVFRYAADCPIGFVDTNGMQACASMLCDPNKKTEKDINHASRTQIENPKVLLARQIESWGGPSVDETKFTEAELYHQLQERQSKYFNKSPEPSSQETTPVKPGGVLFKELDRKRGLFFTNLDRFNKKPGGWMATGPMVNKEEPDYVSSYLDKAEALNTLATIAGAVGGARANNSAAGQPVPDSRAMQSDAPVDNTPIAAVTPPVPPPPNVPGGGGGGGGAETPPSNPGQASKLRAELAAKHIQDASRRGSGSKNPMPPGSGLKADVYHRMASYLTEADLATATVTPIKGGDGVGRTLVQVPSYSFKGKVGIVEYIIDRDGAITHQRFIMGGVIGAGANSQVDFGL